MARQRVECKMLAAGSKLYRHGLWFLTSHQSNQHCICCFVSCRQVVSVCRQKPNGFSHHTHCVNIGGGGVQGFCMRLPSSSLPYLDLDVKFAI